MSTALEKVMREAVQLPQQQRLELAKILIDMDTPSGTMDTPSGSVDTDRAWAAEIRERVRAVEEGRTKGISYDEVLARVDRRLGP